MFFLVAASMNFIWRIDAGMAKLGTEKCKRNSTRKWTKQTRKPPHKVSVGTPGGSRVPTIIKRVKYHSIIEHFKF